METDDINQVIDVIKHAGCSGYYDGHRSQHVLEGIPDWDTYKLAVQYRHQFCKISAVKYIMRKLKPIKFELDKDSRCTYCTHLLRDPCPYGRDAKIPAATFHKGCERWIENECVYF